MQRRRDSSTKTLIAEQIALLRAWDYRWAADSVPTSLAVFWGEEMQRRVGTPARAAGTSIEEYVATKAGPEQLLQALAVASDKIKSDFGIVEDAMGRDQPLPAFD